MAGPGPQPAPRCATRSACRAMLSVPLEKADPLDSRLSALRWQIGIWVKESVEIIELALKKKKKARKENKERKTREPLTNFHNKTCSKALHCQGRGPCVRFVVSTESARNREQRHGVRGTGTRCSSWIRPHLSSWTSSQKTRTRCQVDEPARGKQRILPATQKPKGTGRGAEGGLSPLCPLCPPGLL